VFSVGILRIVTFVNLLVTLYIALSESIVAIAFLWEFAVVASRILADPDF
jgi:hypothetical protein